MQQVHKMMTTGPSKDRLRGTPFFYFVSPADLETLDEFTEYLDCLLHGACRVEEVSGELRLVEGRQLVARVRGLRIHIYSNEHPPPHFHVKSASVDASFRIDNCEFIHGDVSSSDLKTIRYWYKLSRERLIEIWNETRPSECQVGTFRERE